MDLTTLTASWDTKHSELPVCLLCSEHPLLSYLFFFFFVFFG